MRTGLGVCLCMQGDLGACVSVWSVCMCVYGVRMWCVCVVRVCVCVWCVCVARVCDACVWRVCVARVCGVCVRMCISKRMYS